MKTNPRADVHVILRNLRWRLIVREFLDVLAVCALIAGGGLVAFEAGLHIFAGRPLDLWAAAPGVPLVVLLIAANAILRRRPLESIAALADARGKTKDRLTTALALSRGENPGVLPDLAREECAAFLDRTDFRPLVPLHAPRAGMWLAVPLVALALLRFDFAVRQGAADAEAAKAQAAIADTVSQIEQLTRMAEQAQQRERDEELKKLAEQLAASAQRLRAQTNVDDAKKAALRELSALEEAMRELQRQPSPADEMKELAKALSQLPGMEDVLKALNEKNLAEAQRALDRAKQAQKSGADQPSEEQVEKALREAMQNLAERRELSDALQRLADQMKQGAGSASQQAMQQLAQMLQQAQKNQQGDNSPQRQMTMKELIAALENAKFGESQNQDQQRPGGSKQGEGGQVSIQSFAQRDSNGPPQSGDTQSPTGKPGGERDLGTTDTPFGDKSNSQEKGSDLALKGQLGQGETLSMMLPSAGDQSRAARRYKDLYDSAAAAALDATQQENIPLGSRFLIKRYFESIRPQE